MKPPPRRVEGRLPGGHSAAGEGSRASGVRPSSIQLVACGVGTALDDDGQMLTAIAEATWRLPATAFRWIILCIASAGMTRGAGLQLAN
jgi:hypothetical protein